MTEHTLNDIIKCHQRLTSCIKDPESSEIHTKSREWANALHSKLETAFQGFLTSPYVARNRINEVVNEVNYARAEASVDSLYNRDKKRLRVES